MTFHTSFRKADDKKANHEGNEDNEEWAIKAAGDCQPFSPKNAALMAKKSMEPVAGKWH